MTTLSTVSTTASVESAARTRGAALGQTKPRSLWYAMACASALALVLSLQPQRASAVDYPLTLQSLAFAKAEATKFNNDRTAYFGKYTYQADTETSPGFTPSMYLDTPFFSLMFAYADAANSYTSVKASDRDELLHESQIRCNVYLFSTELNFNNSAVGVIKQHGAVIHADSTKIDPDQKVVDSPEVGYQTEITFSFNAKKLHVNQPFVVTIANIPVKDQESGEVNFSIDASAIR